MICYRISDTASELSITAEEKCILDPAEISADEESTVHRAAESWQLRYHLLWLCCARSDNGIDHSEVKNRKVLPISPDTIVLRNGAAVGCFTEDHLFLFDDTSTHCHRRVKDCGYVGGWGDIAETEYYELETADPAAAAKA